MKDVAPALTDDDAQLMKQSAQLLQEIEQRVQDEAVPALNAG